MLTFFCFPVALPQAGDGKPSAAQQIAWLLVCADLGFWEHWIHVDFGYIWNHLDNFGYFWICVWNILKYFE